LTPGKNIIIVLVIFGGGMGKQKKIEAENYNKEEKNFKLPDNFKKLIPIVAAITIVVIAVLIYAYSLSTTDKKETTQKTVKECGEIVAESNVVEGKAPFVPMLTAKLSGNYTTGKAACHWKLDGATSHDTYPVNGTCVFAFRGIATPGDHTISYEVDGLKKNCPQSIKIKVNKK
jgi:hypothetical protein